ncbi:unnamed protein product [Coffea canephora]|uniref:Uncharacterized protein n=1 Tax=Coffea canephora TaxID=49390 RepID=A0A068V5N9_COFCA|nr:unnamed protein product [Coffea canephora]
MGRNTDDKRAVPVGRKGTKEDDLRKSLFKSIARSPVEDGRPSSMIIRKKNTVIPAHIVAEAISTLHAICPSQVSRVLECAGGRWRQDGFI